MSEIATLFKNIDNLSRSDIRLVSDYVNKIIKKKSNSSLKKQKRVDLSKYQEVGKTFNIDASDYIKELRNEW